MLGQPSFYPYAMYLYQYLGDAEFEDEGNLEERGLRFQQLDLGREGEV